MYIFLMIVHVIISVALVMIILAQSGKGGALDGFVGGTASSIFGVHGASEFLDKWTKILGAVWLLSSLFLAMNVRSMKGGGGSTRALDRLRKAESTTEQRTDVETAFPIDEEAAIPAGEEIILQIDDEE